MDNDNEHGSNDDGNENNLIIVLVILQVMILKVIMGSLFGMMMGHYSN